MVRFAQKKIMLSSGMASLLPTRRVKMRMNISLTGEKEHHKEKRLSAWSRVWQHLELMRYKKKEHADFWCWDHNFFIATIEELAHFWEVVKGENNV